MRVYCDVCENNAAEVMCCADEAALCGECDQRVHAANKLANKHQRVLLISSSPDTTICDICQEKNAFFFCMEDRAILCRNCDVAIHLPNTLSASHRRFLLSGIRVGLNSISAEDSPGASAPEDSRAVPVPTKSPTPPSSHYPGPASNPLPLPDKFANPFSKSSASTSRSTQPSHSLSALGSIRGAQTLAESRATLAGIGNAAANRDYLPGRDGFSDIFGGESSIWQVDELLNIPELADGYSLADIGSSKAETNNLGDFDWTADLSLFDEQVYAESLHEVPQLPSPLASSSKSRSNQGSNKNSRSHQDLAALVPDFDDAFVPDIGAAPVPKKRRY